MTDEKESGITPGYEAFNYIFRPHVEDGEGSLHLWLGNTRMGKSYANRILVAEQLNRKHTDVVLTIDDKNAELPMYGGTQRANTDDLLARPLTSEDDASHINFRGVAYRSNLGDAIEHGKVARLVWDMKRVKPALRITLNIDELADATNGKQSWLDDTNATIYRKGAGVKISTTATTQLPQLLPREAYGLSQTIGIFQLDAREADYLVHYRLITPDVLPRLEGLERGQFLLYVRGAGSRKGLLPNVFKF